MIRFGMTSRIIFWLVILILLALVAATVGVLPIIILGVGVTLFYYGFVLGFKYYYLVGSAICILLGVITIFVDFGF